MKTKPQAHRATRAQIDLEIQRRRTLGEQYIGDDDEPSVVELVVTGVILLAVLLLLKYGWPFGWPL